MTAIDNPNGNQTMSELQRQQRQFLAPPAPAGGDSGHPGAGALSILLGTDAEADGTSATAVGPQAMANGASSSAYGSGAEAAGFRATAAGASSSAQQDRDSAFGYAATADGGWSVAVGPNATVESGEGAAFGSGTFVATGHDRSTAIGADAATTAANQVMLGTSGDTVVVPGTFSNPSARRLKRNIIPAPDLRSIYPDLVEYEYIDGDGRRRIGYIADDLLGTDAERFVTFDDEGNVAGIDPIGLLIAQVAVMHADIVALKNKDSDGGKHG